jgi:alginate O-acetyltransferase complex protein AlgJ
VGFRLAVAIFGLLMGAWAPPSGVGADDEDGSAAFAPDAVGAMFIGELASLVANAEQGQRHVIRGKDDWLFFVPELRSVCAGPFWGRSATGVSRASDPRYADPLEPIVDFAAQLRQVGVRLLLVPVPAKAHVYPDMISEAVSRRLGEPMPRLDSRYREFVELLRDHGIAVLDLLPHLLSCRDDPEGGTYCKTDSHWSPRACALTAKLIALNKPSCVPLGTHDFVTERRRIEISGDLARMSDSHDPQREELEATFVGRKAGDTLRPIEPDRQSPIVLMGDSHVLVFHDPALYTKGAGLPDHLALEFGFPMDLIGVRGSGVNVPRITLMRRGDDLQGKKLVIWCFSVREFTENESGWRRVPVVRNSTKSSGVESISTKQE